eukprot:2170021-Heterocapsa_arctica.AAC.1
MQAVEDNILRDLEDNIVSSIPGARITVYMFDGAVIVLPSARLDDLTEVLGRVGGKWNVKFHTTAFPVNMM